jgi:DNA-binding NarL/FixJ family response regulator
MTSHPIPDSPDTELRVLLVSPDVLGRAGLAAVLGAGSAAYAVDPSEVEIWLQTEATPDVVVWDLGWGVDEIPAELRAVHEARIPLLVLADQAGQAAELRALGGLSILSRTSETEALLAALHAAALGLIVTDPAFEVRPPLGRAEGAEALEPLTPRENQVLQLLAEGLTNKTIALRLGIKETTVKFHVNSLLAKLGAQSRTEAVTRAARLGLLLL